MKGRSSGRRGCCGDSYAEHGNGDVGCPPLGQNGGRRRPGEWAMNADAIMWVSLFILGLAVAGYLVAVLLNPEKW
ncbi:hypothetical protein AAU01_05270 [Paenarthrobacter aurescens]|uniref:Potassium-transporting ATPase subunit F n=1 Tax=Paenarthrobacter aurescens TaxID=43663 RepID=A0A4Y3N893_PAEAU|nr:hypothetical protein AAU01_05270 [Paenarthrobacter aurescens]